MVLCLTLRTGKCDVDRKEAVLAMLEGKKIVHDDYGPNSYMYFDNMGGFLYYNYFERTVPVTTVLHNKDGYSILTKKSTMKRWVENE